MANRYRNLIYSNAEYTQTYTDFRGVELNSSGLTGSKSRLAYVENMYKDYDGDGACVLESIPGFRCFAHYEKPIHGLYYQRSSSGSDDHILVHAGDSLMRHPVSNIDSKSYGEEIATLNPQKSFAFEYGPDIYVADGERMLKISDDGACLSTDDDGALPYVPTTYVSGEAYEQRNLLTDSFKEEYYVGNPNAYLYTSGSLRVVITDEDQRYCSINGIDSRDTELYIPAYINISGVEYKVVSIDSHAFEFNEYITAVYIAEGVVNIGSFAFFGCPELKRIVLSSTVTTIEDYAFYACTALETLYFGAGLKHIGKEALYGTYALADVYYALRESDFYKIEGVEDFDMGLLSFVEKYDALKIELPLHEEVIEIKEVQINGLPIDYEIREKDGMIKSISIFFDAYAEATGIKIVVEGTLAPMPRDWAKGMSLSYVSPRTAIFNCTLAEVFDGRVFFSGNPAFPNTIFYTEAFKSGESGALYVGRYNYFNDGIGNYAVKSILAVRDMLAVFKEGDDGSGSIFYHKKETTGIDTVATVYPVAYVHSGISAVGKALSFLDDPVFLTNEGLMALNGENINYQRNVACRSHNVNYALLKEDLSKASLCEWLGYLVVGIGDKMFLADSRAIFEHATGSREYEWFFANKIGAFAYDSTVFRYSAEAMGNALVHPSNVGEAVDSRSVYSAYDSMGEMYYYVTEGSTKYRVVATEERTGGSYYPAELYISHGKHLFFSTANGHVCVFNNDMRGVAPDTVKNTPGFNKDEYRELMGTKIHPYFYSFDGHAPTYLIKTSLDDCGVPHLTKSTVKKSLVVKAKSQSNECIECEVSIDGHDPVFIDSFPYVGVSFDDFDFNEAPWSVHRYDSYALPEKEKRWIEKQITLRTSAYASPISVYSIAYRYVIKGKIKNNT